MAEFETDDKLYCEIARLELDWIKKGQDQLAVTRLNWIDTDGPVVLTCQCELAGVATGQDLHAPASPTNVL